MQTTLRNTLATLVLAMGLETPGAAPAQSPSAPEAAILPASLSAPVQKGPAYEGDAFDTERGGRAYHEEHQECFLAGRHVATRSQFKSPDGKPMAERELDYTHSFYKPDYLFRDLRNGYEEGARVEANDVRVFYRDSAHAPLLEKKLAVPEPCVINGGFNLYLKQNWDSLEAGRHLPFNMVVPARLDYYRFVAYEDAMRTITPQEAGGRKAKAVVVEPQNSLLRMLLPTIVVFYDVDTKQMIRYQGISNIADAKGRSLRVRIDYPRQGP